MSKTKDLIEDIENINKQVVELYKELRVIETKSNNGFYKGRKIGKESWWKKFFRK